MTLVILRIGNVAAIPRDYQISVTVPELVSDDSGRVTIPEGLYRVGMTPIVESGYRQTERFTYALVTTEGR